MRKLVVVIISVMCFVFISSSSASAGNCQCVSWTTTTVCHGVQYCPYPYNHIVCSPAGCTTYSKCGSQVCQTCGPGSYVCNSGCCPIGTPPPGGGGGGGGGGGCTVSNAGAPTLTTPANGYVSPTTAVNLSWTAPASWGNDCGTNTTKKYTVKVDTVNPPVTVATTVNDPTTSYTFTGTYGSTYYWDVTASNASGGTASGVYSFSIKPGVTGTVYYDSNNTCSTSTPWTKVAGLTATLRGTGYSGTVASSGTGAGTYAIIAPSASYSYLDLSVPTNYTCSTACGGCPTKTGVTSPSTGNNFFLTDVRPAWWQAVGSSVYAGSTAGGVTVQSQIPLASQSLIVPGTVGGTGALLRASGTANLGSGTVSSTGWNTVSSYFGKTMDYQYFASQMGVTPATASYTSADTLTQPTYDPAKDFWYAKPPSGTATLASAWSVPASESYVVFVSGNLDINQNVTVTSGGFLTFIVSGNVTVDPSVTSMQGIYISTGSFTTNSQYVKDVTNDTQLVISGNVIAWGGVHLNRDLGADNVSTPAEQFVFRPDLLTNMPSKMKSFSLRWQEVPAGTFGN